VRVVEVVEGVEEPVLERELAGAVRLGGDVRIDGRPSARRDPFRPLLVIASRVERIAGEVEVVLEAADEVLRDRSELHEVGAIPRAA
jgi:hypothetical protein